MIESAVDYDYLTKSETEQLLKVVDNQKHKLIILLLLDAGLRISECVSLKYENFDFRLKLLYVKSLKKRSKEEYRKIPLSDRLYHLLTEYASSQPKIANEAYLFPSCTIGHITRFSVNRFMQRLIRKHNITNKLHPHALRHTFATNLVANATPLEQVKIMLGHTSYNTTLVYAHVPDNVLRASIHTVERSQKSRLSLLVDFFYKPSTKRINLMAKKSFVVGRRKELALLNVLVEKNVNVLITGKIGVGKSAMLDNLETKKTKLIFDDTTNLKKTLINLLVYLYKGDKEAVYKLIYPDLNFEALEEKLTRESIANLCDEIKRICTAYEYVLVIKSLDGISPKGISVLESFKSHFVIVATAREIPLNKSSFVWNFEQIELKNLNRTESFEMIQKLASGLEIEDYELFRSHVYEQTDGNPRAISELVERYSKEPVIDVQTIRSISHVGALREIDMSVFVLLFIASVAILRYLTGELENPAFRVLGGAAMILLLFSRTIFARAKRKFI